MTFTYTSCLGDVIEFGGDSPYFADPDVLLGYELEYTYENLSVSSIRQSKIERILPITIFAGSDDEGCELLARLSDAFECDARASTPGKIEVDGYVSCAYVTKMEVDQSEGLTEIEVVATLLFEVGEWERTTTYSFERRSVSSQNSGVGFPHDYPHDFGSKGQIGVIDNPSPLPCDAVITIYGPVANPYVIIGGNRYEVEAVIDDGGYLVIDGSGRTEKKITLKSKDGVETNAFSLRRGTQKRGSGSFVFEQIKPGLSTVDWSGAFGFDVALVERRSMRRCRPWR